MPETMVSRMEHFIGCHVEPGSMVCTKENRIYSGLKNYHTVNHGAGEYVQRPYISTA